MFNYGTHVNTFIICMKNYIVSQSLKTVLYLGKLHMKVTSYVRIAAFLNVASTWRLNKQTQNIIADDKWSIDIADDKLLRVY